jgi:hypothetical protein
VGEEHGVKVDQGGGDGGGGGGGGGGDGANVLVALTDTLTQRQVPILKIHLPSKRAICIEDGADFKELHI